VEKLIFELELNTPISMIFTGSREPYRTLSREEKNWWGGGGVGR